MFPIPWNFPFRKKNGNLVNIGDAIDEGTELPEHGEGDAGKVLSVDENGDLEWSDDVNSEIQTLTNEVDTVVNDLSAKNIFDFEGWLKSNNVAFTKSNNAYSFTTASALLNNPYQFSDDDIDIIYSGDITLETAINCGLSFYDKNDVEIARRLVTKTVVRGVCKVKLDWSNGGTLTVDSPMIRPAGITSDYYVPYAMTNRELTEALNKRTDLTASNLANGVTLNGDSFFIEIGKLCVLHVNIKVPALSTGTGTILISGLPVSAGVNMATLYNNVNGRSTEVYFEGPDLISRGTLSVETIFQQTLVYICT